MEREAAAAFDGGGGDPGMAEPARDDHRRRGEGIGVGVADEPAFEQDVAAVRFVDEGRALAKRRGGVGDRIPGFVLDIDQGSGVFRRIRIPRDDGGDDLARETHFGPGDQRPGGGAIAVPVGLVHAGGNRRCRLGEVGAGKDPDHAVHRASRRAIDTGDPRAGERASQEVDVQASRRVEIVEEISAAEYQGPAVVDCIGCTQRSAPYQCSARSR